MGRRFARRGRLALAAVQAGWALGAFVEARPSDLMGCLRLGADADGGRRDEDAVGPSRKTAL